MYTIKSGNLMVLIGENGFIDGKKEGFYFMDTRVIGKIIPEMSPKFEFLSLEEYKNNSICFWFISKTPDSFYDKDLILKLKYIVDEEKFIVKSEFFNYSPENTSIFVNFVIDYTFNDIFEIRAGKLENRKVELSGDEWKKIVKYESSYLIHNLVVDNPTSRKVEVKPQVPEIISFSITPSFHFKTKTMGTDIFDNAVHSKINLDVSNFRGKLSKLVKKATEDVEMLLLDTKYGKFPAAGLPWFATVFGRDSLIFTIQTMDLFPEISHDILKVLSITQSRKTDDQKDAIPGKIVHEIRVGEYALSDKVPFSAYYGSIDATPLFLMAIGKYSKLYGRAIFEELKGSIESAAHYIDENVDSRGYLYYRQRSSNGLSNQGWKDSGNSVVFANGKMATPPVRLVEVQAYLYEAYITLSSFYTGKVSEFYKAQAKHLKENFNADFWMKDEKFFALAMDENDKQVNSITSNPGHCLMTDIISDERARLIVDRLMEPDMFTGWGIRTMSSEMTSYNPIAYHNGSVWPHDTSIIMMGMQEKGFKIEARRLGRSLLDAAEYFEWRLPELFGGNERRDKNIIPYPVACSPQLWSVGAEFVISKILKEG